MRGKPAALFAVFLVVPSVLTFVRLSEAASNTSDYKLVKKITLGGEGGWDYFSVDPSTGHVFIPRGDLKSWRCARLLAKGERNDTSRKRMTVKTALWTATIVTAGKHT